MDTSVCSKIVNGGIHTNLVIISRADGRGEGLEAGRTVLPTSSAIFFLNNDINSERVMTKKFMCYI